MSSDDDEVERRGRRPCCCVGGATVHWNSLGSLWYGLTAVGLQSFIVYKCVSRFLLYVALPWPEDQQPYLELNLYVGLVGAGVVLAPFFFVSFMFKIGNLANDEFKMGFQLSSCDKHPMELLPGDGGFVQGAWQHGGPTAPLIHLVSAFCFILPKIFIEAKLLEVGFLSRENIWKTDLDFALPRVIIVNFLSGLGSLNDSTTTQAPYLHPAAQIREYLEESDDGWHPFSPEFLNYALALAAYSIRYPAVFWNTNKTFSFLFSAQLLLNSLQNLVSLSGFSIMYKVHRLGPQNVLQKYQPFLLNASICSLLFLLGCAIVAASSCVLYMYGYQKFAAFVDAENDKHCIAIRSGGAGTSLWAHFPHCSAMCVLIALVVCNGPLLYDYTLIYKGSLDCVVLAAVASTTLHLLLWILLWLALTAKRSWRFKLRVTVGRSVVKSARSIKLLNDVELRRPRRGRPDAKHDDADDPMMIVAFGKSFTVTESGPKKLIMNTLARAAIERDKALEEGQPPLATASSSSGMNTVPRTGQRVAFHEGTAVNTSQSGTSSSLVASTRSPRLPRVPTTTSATGVASTTDRVQQQEPPRFASPQEAVDTGHRLQPPPAAASSPRPFTRKNVDVQDAACTPRSYDSGLVPTHDDLTPRSDNSLSTASSAVSPPDHHHQQLQQQQQIYATASATVAIRPTDDDDDPYGRIAKRPTLTSFTDRDPRIIDLPAANQRQPNFNTLPVNGSGGGGSSQASRTNTLPAPAPLPTGRHFKPFDHRGMNPMAGIQEDRVVVGRNFQEY